MAKQTSSRAALPAARESSLAMMSLVTGILGLTLFPFLGSIAAVITGYLARKEIGESMGGLGGEGLANAGLALGWAGVALSIIGLCFFGALFAIPFCLAILSLGSGIQSEMLTGALLLL